MGKRGNDYQYLALSRSGLFTAICMEYTLPGPDNIFGSTSLDLVNDEEQNFIGLGRTMTLKMMLF